MIKEKLISDVLLQLYQGSLTDDKSLEDSQVAHWATIHLNDLVKREIMTEKEKGHQVPPIYIIREIARPITEEEVDDIDDENQRMYVELEGEVLDLPRDGGIVKVLDYDLNLIHPASTEGIGMLSDFRFASPSSENPLYYREGKKIFIKGFNSADLDFNDIMVHYVKKQDVIALEDEDEILISDKLIPALMDLIVQRGKLELYGTQPDASSDSVDRKQPVYHTAISNPSKQVEPETEQQ